MKLVGIMPARNESWVLGVSVRALLLWADEAVVLDHASTDETPDILAKIKGEVGDRLHVIREENPSWAEMAHRQRTLEKARQIGATHCAIVDADEVLSGNLLGWIRGQIECLPAGALLQVPMRNMYGDVDRPRVDQYRKDFSIWGNTVTTVAFADSPQLNWAATNGYQHHAREPKGSRVGLRIFPQQIEGGVMHLQFSSRRRLLAKHFRYQLHERATYPNKDPQEIRRTYSAAPDWTNAIVYPTPPDWWDPYADFMKYLDLEAEPWQIEECRRMIERYPGIEAGMDSFGVMC
jgi:hypothetical protein